MRNFTESELKLFWIASEAVLENQSAPLSVCYHNPLDLFDGSLSSAKAGVQRSGSERSAALSGPCSEVTSWPGFSIILLNLFSMRLK